MSEPTLVPPYLAEPVNSGHIFGTLKYEKKKERWRIEGEPSVLQMAKRLFPGSRSAGSGAAYFPANKRSTADLNWLMLRFPLHVENEEEWQLLRTEAIQHVMRRQELNARPARITPPTSFVGQLRPFQEEGLAYLLHNERTLLADEMGLGKTPTALAWLSAIEQWPAIIVVQPHTLRQWAREINKFLRLKQPGQTRLFNESSGNVFHIVKGLKPYELPQASIYLIHYLLLRAWKKELVDFGFKAVVFDEIQELRHTGTEKYSAASYLSSSVQCVTGLSGTPIYNHGGEMWAVMNILEYHCLGDWDSFTREWCYGYGTDKVRDPQMLGDYLRREGLMLRRTKDQVLKELPPKRRYVQEIDADKGLYDGLIGNAVSLAVEASKAEIAFDRGRIAREAINETRRITGLAKAGHVCAFVKALLDAGEKVILFAYHHDVWDHYQQALASYKPVFITGRESPAQKDESQRAFMAGDTNLICVSLRASTGLNLQRASVVVFGELDWSPAIHSQSEDRAHRIGQEDSVLCYYLVCDEGTDQDMIEALGFKVEQFTGIMGDRPATEEDKAIAQTASEEHMRRVLDRLRQRAAKEAA